METNDLTRTAKQIKRMLKILDILMVDGPVTRRYLLEHVSNGVDIKPKSLSRSLERDFQLIEAVFGIKIKHDDQKGYYIYEYAHFTYDYVRKICNIEGYMNEKPCFFGDKWKKYVLLDCRLSSMPVLHDIALAMEFKCWMEFDYADPIQKDKVMRKKVRPHSMKEFQNRYLISCDEDDKVESFDMSRIHNAHVLYHRDYKPNKLPEISAIIDENCRICENCGAPYMKIK